MKIIKWNGNLMKENFTKEYFMEREYFYFYNFVFSKIQLQIVKTQNGDIFTAKRNFGLLHGKAVFFF